MDNILQHLDSPDVLRRLIEAGADITVKDVDGANALHLIAAKRNPVLESAQVLLDAGTPIDELDSRLRTPLFRAVYEGESSETVSWLLDHGAAIDVPSVRYTPLQAASHYCLTNVMFLLLDAGANPNISTPEATITPLVQAIDSQSRLVEAVTLLLAYGADPAFAGYGRETPLAKAAYLACSERKPSQINVVFQLLDAADRRGTPLAQNVVNDAFSRCSHHYVHDIFALFLNRGANANSPLGENIESEYTRPLILACETEDIPPEHIDFLIRQRADPTLTGTNGRSPLHAAACNGVVSAIAPLLGSGAVIDQPDDRGRTALHVACDMYKNLVPDEYDLQTQAGLFMGNPVDLASMNEREKNTYRMFVETTADRLRRCLHQLEFVRRLLEAGASPTAQDNDGATAMHFASITDDLQLVLLILQAPFGRYVLVDNSGKTPLHWAAEHGAANVVRAMISRPSAGLTRRPAFLERMVTKTCSLLEKSHEVNATATTTPPSQVLCYSPFIRRILPYVSDRDGRRALHVAAAAGKGDVVAALLERSDLPLTRVDNVGISAMRLAEERNHLGCISKIRVALRKQKAAREYSLRMERLSACVIYFTSAVLILGVLLGLITAAKRWSMELDWIECNTIMQALEFICRQN
ncbi:ankyrin repeat protein [Trichoderma virens Gv29-8]|uniref:Ankyrin repeat protein n=1 Tax=Hypocrea virens (strain Gv29-8 / FGSC 10586) TaxID=413071 RepID=G9MSP7_HYPVG|nr:ankyrin repeat protein [Trichoderma virens Gv29-8]EHK22208.1 ankyrin repeat protein [Trichoderma virens Gv29-8]UKZ47245.1 hypothetical protein TrVGV298_001462 [Trichoderma virens]